jgi:diketogulonate reductase-like aldo/keto reductase
MSYGTLGSPGRASAFPDRPAPPAVLSDPTVASIAAAHGKTPGQVLLRHLVQQGVVVIPKSVREERVRENFDLFDFVLTEEEMGRLDALDRGSAARSFSMAFLKSDDDVTALREYPYTPADEY